MEFFFEFLIFIQWFLNQYNVYVSNHLIKIYVFFFSYSYIFNSIIQVFVVYTTKCYALSKTPNEIMLRLLLVFYLQ